MSDLIDTVGGFHARKERRGRGETLAQLRPPGAPAPGPIPDWAAAESNAVQWLRWLGHPDAERTRSGADDGIDVRSVNAVAQVKWYGKPVGVRPLRELVGAAERSTVKLYFFCNAGFTRDAIRYADRVDIALFVFSPANGLMSAANTSAVQLFAASTQRHSRPSAETRPGSGRFEAVVTAIREAQVAHPPPEAPGRIAIAILLTPVAMCMVGGLVIAFFAKNPDLAPPWLRNVWAIWMTVACLGALPALLLAGMWPRGRVVRRSSNRDERPV